MIWVPSKDLEPRKFRQKVLRHVFLRAIIVGSNGVETTPSQSAYVMDSSRTAAVEPSVKLPFAGGTAVARRIPPYHCHGRRRKRGIFGSGCI